MSGLVERPALRPEIGVEHFADGALVLDDGELTRLDAVGAAVVELLDASRTVGDVVHELAARYGARPEQVRADVDLFLQALDARGLLDGTAAAPDVSPDPSTTDRVVFDVRKRTPPEPPTTHRSVAHASLGWTFEIRSCDAQMGQYLGEILAPFASNQEPEHRYDIHRDLGSGTWEVWVDAELALRTPRTWLVVSWMLWHVTQQTIAVTRTHLLLHAGAVALGDRAVVLCGPMNSGKSTLTGALVERGWTYLTDEAVAFDLADGSLTPYPRPLVVEGRSRELLKGLAPPPSWRARFRRRAWHLDLTDGTPPSSGSIRPVAFVLPSVRLDGPTALEPITAIDAMEGLCRNAWNLRGLGPSAFALLARTVRYSACYSMHVNDLAGAEQLLRAAIAPPSGPEAPMAHCRV